MNLMTKAVLFLVLVVFINDVLALLPHIFESAREYHRYMRLKKVSKDVNVDDRPTNGWDLPRYYRYPRPRKIPKDNVDDRTIKLFCDGSNSIKGLNGDLKFHCSPNPKCKSTYLSGVVAKTSTGEINYICKGYIKGISYRRFNRQYEIQCCHDKPTKSIREDCYWTGWQNCFGSLFKFWVPNGYYMAGIRSEYNSSVKNGYSRIWDFYVCK